MSVNKCVQTDFRKFKAFNKLLIPAIFCAFGMISVIFSSYEWYKAESLKYEDPE